MKKLEPEGMVFYRNGEVVRCDRAETRRLWGVEEFPEDIPSPEVAHLEITGRCNLNCGYCYVEKTGSELPREWWEGIIDQLAGAGVFQVTFGGGEPLLRKDLPWLAERARGRGLDVCMTTNGLLLPQHGCELDCYSQVNVSYHGEADVVSGALECLAVKRLRRGMNVVMRRGYARELGRLAELAGAADAELLLLTYKTREETGEAWEAGEALSPVEVLKLAREVKGTARVAVDGATAGECWCNYRFVDVDSEGRLLPCSFIRTPEGDLTREPFAEVWARRRKYQRCPYLPLDNGHCWQR